MPVSYAKWDNLDDSDDDEKSTTSASLPARDSGMDEFLSLGRDASVSQIQEKIKNMSAETRESLLRHEKGGLLRRVLELDPSKSYEAGEIFGTADPPATAKKVTPATAKKKPPALKPTPKPKETPAPPAPPAAPPARKSVPFVDVVDDEPRIVDVTDEIAASPAPAVAPPPAPVSAAPAPAPAPAVLPPPAPTPAAPASSDAIQSILGLTEPPSTALAPPSFGDYASFTFVRLPADINSPIEAQTGYNLPGGDTLPTLLAPLFKSDLKFDEKTFAQHMAAAVEQAHETTAAQGKVKPKGAPADGAEGPKCAPTIADLELHSARGVCEAWPLASASAENSWIAVKLYIDEVGALRKRARNARAEALVTASGQLGLAIHGDAYVGRLELGSKFGEENNLDLGVDELSQKAPWLAEARKLRENEKERRGYDANAQIDKSTAVAPTFTSGGDTAGGVYTWSQDAESVEVRVLKHVPTGANAKHRIKVKYGSGGDELHVAVDGQSILDVAPLFGRVQPFECSWSLDGSELMINLEKCDAKPWLDLTVPSELPTGTNKPPTVKPPAPKATTAARAPVATKAAMPAQGDAPERCDSCRPDRAEGGGRRHEH